MSSVRSAVRSATVSGCKRTRAQASSTPGTKPVVVFAGGGGAVASREARRDTDADDADADADADALERREFAAIERAAAAAAATDPWDRARSFVKTRGVAELGARTPLVAALWHHAWAPTCGHGHGHGHGAVTRDLCALVASYVPASDCVVSYAFGASQQLARRVLAEGDGVDVDAFASPTDPFRAFTVLTDALQYLQGTYRCRRPAAVSASAGTSAGAGGQTSSSLSSQQWVYSTMARRLNRTRAIRPDGRAADDPDADAYVDRNALGVSTVARVHLQPAAVVLAHWRTGLASLADAAANEDAPAPTGAHAVAPARGGESGGARASPLRADCVRFCNEWMTALLSAPDAAWNAVATVTVGPPPAGTVARAGSRATPKPTTPAPMTACGVYAPSPTHVQLHVQHSVVPDRLCVNVLFQLRDEPGRDDADYY